jgi:hypothetical protein
VTPDYFPRHFHAPGQWPWDHWERHALECGLAADLANLGRAVMREADQHAWCWRLMAECGWNDAGRAMLARLLAHPRRTAARLEWLLETDGQRFDPWQHNEYHEDSPCWKAMRAKWNREQQREASSPITSNP